VIFEKKQQNIIVEIRNVRNLSFAESHGKSLIAGQIYGCHEIFNLEGIKWLLIQREQLLLTSINGMVKILLHRKLRIDAGAKDYISKL
jgi:hypothetical protein